MPRAPIRPLPETLINQIAAGEVIERPSSVVKELVENSLDAGATRVDILLKEGGKNEIAILDDGHGIPPEELALAFERHSTSKLAEAADLERLGTYGFRGEALASLASVAEVELKSRTPEKPQAHVLTVRYGEPLGEPKAAAGPVGTSITVRRLFSEVPARLKFLRSAATEFSHAADTVRELALGAPQAKLFLKHNGRSVREYVNGQRESRFQEAFRPEWAPLHLRESVEDMDLEAFLSPSHLIQSRGDLSLFINGRSVRNRNLISAVRNAYLDTLGPQHDPSGAVFLDIRPDWIDVNVHPQKLEVRCLRGERIYQWLRASLRKAISLSTSVREVPLAAPRAAEFVSDPAPAYVPQPLLDEAVEFALVAEVPTVEPQAPPTPFVPKPVTLKYLGQVKASYLICEDSKGVVIVDQHALHEKMEFEKIRAAHRTGRTPVQRLLVARIVKGDPTWEAVLAENADLVTKLGFEIESFGGGDFAVKACPTVLPEARLGEVLREIVEALRTAPASSPDVLERVLHKTFATIACHSVVRAGQRLTPLEAERLLSGLDDLEEGWTCPHGRPVLLRVGYPAIEKHFERV